MNGQNISFFRRFRYEVISPSTSSSTAVNSDSNNAADAHVIGASAKKYDTYGFDVEAALQDLAKPGENTVTLYFGKVKKPEQGWGISIEFDKQAGLAQLPLSTLKMDAAIENVNRFIDRKGEVAEVNGTAQGKEACVTVSLLDTESKKIIGKITGIGKEIPFSIICLTYCLPIPTSISRLCTRKEL